MSPTPIDVLKFATVVKSVGLSNRAGETIEDAAHLEDWKDYKAHYEVILNSVISFQRANDGKVIAEAAGLGRAKYVPIKSVHHLAQHLSIRSFVL